MSGSLGRGHQPRVFTWFDDKEDAVHIPVDVVLGCAVGSARLVYSAKSSTTRGPTTTTGTDRNPDPVVFRNPSPAAPSSPSRPLPPRSPPLPGDDSSLPFPLPVPEDLSALWKTLVGVCGGVPALLLTAVVGFLCKKWRSLWVKLRNVKVDLVKAKADLDATTQQKPDDTLSTSTVLEIDPPASPIPQSKSKSGVVVVSAAKGSGHYSYCPTPPP